MSLSQVFFRSQLQRLLDELLPAAGLILQALCSLISFLRPAQLIHRSMQASPLPTQYLRNPIGSHREPPRPHSSRSPRELFCTRNFPCDDPSFIMKGLRRLHRQAVGLTQFAEFSDLCFILRDRHHLLKTRAIMHVF